MKNKKNRQYSAQLFMTIISLMGWAIFLFSLFHLPVVFHPFELMFLMLFIFVCEYYPMPFRKGNSSLTFPVVYLVYLVYGIEIAITLYFVSVLATTVINRRPLRIIFFNSAQLIVSLTTAHVLMSLFAQVVQLSPAAMINLSFLVFICSFYIINNLIVDIVLLLRPEKYSFSIWAEKGRGELFSFSISLVYGFLLHFLGSQNRGEVDIFSYFFFLSPLVFLALISSVIIRLRADKQRLKALFEFSSEMNKLSPIKEWETEIKRLMYEVVTYEEAFLFTRDEKGIWKLMISQRDHESAPDQFHNFNELEQVRNVSVYNKQDLQGAPLSSMFHPNTQSAVYAPLHLDHDLIGCLILTKSRTKSFVFEDMQSIATIANQLAIFLKTQTLFSEKEQRILLEERNRIAHDIHDGIAQTLAGAVMKFDIASKKIHSQPAAAEELIISSNHLLRDGLKEIRDSIYALRPYPTEQLGLHSAIQKKVDELNSDDSLPLTISFQSRGVQARLSLLTEKVIFSIIQESIQNGIKHSRASTIEVLISYQKDQVFLKIKDDGIGFSLYEAMTLAMKEPHYGILQMNEDAEKIGATLQIESKEKRGTEIIARIPKMGFEGG